MELDPIIFGQRLRHFRKQRGMTLDQLGASIGRPAPFLSLMENGKREAKLSHITGLAAALGIQPADLLSAEPPNHRAALEIGLERAQRHPRYAALGLPHLKPSAKVPDEALEHILALFDVLAGDDSLATAGQDELRRATGQITAWLRARDGYIAEIEHAAADLLEHCDYPGTGPLTSRHLNDLISHMGYQVSPIDDIPARLRSVIDHRNRRIYVAQRNELRTRQARKAVLQTLASLALGHERPSGALGLLRHRLESAYFAAAVLVPEQAALPVLRDARSARDLSVEDVKEQFYVSYEMAAQRFTNLATRHFGIQTHMLRTDEDGLIWKAYANDGVPLPTDEAGVSEGRTVCKMWGASAAYRSDSKFDIHYQFTDTPAGSYWCATHIAADLSGHAFTVGVRYEDARLFRGRRTDRQLRSECPGGACCHNPDIAARWEGVAEGHVRMRERIVGLLRPTLGEKEHLSEVYEVCDRHRRQEEASQSETTE